MSRSERPEGPDRSERSGRSEDLGRSEGSAPGSGRGAGLRRFKRPGGRLGGGAGSFTAPRYGRWVGVLALVILALITLNTILTPSNGLAGLAPGTRVPPFAVPLATGDLPGDANIATRPNDGSAGRRPACTVRGPRILNICQLYEQGPLVLALFIDASACTGILDEMQTLAGAGGGRFAGVRFAGVAIKGERTSLRALVRSRGLSFPIGVDSDGVLPALYKMASCPQVTFAYPGGVVQSRALLVRPSLAVLRARVSELVGEARARGWRPPR